MILRKAAAAEKEVIWEIIQYAIEQRRLDGSRQWQDGYPNPASIQHDMDNGYAYVVEEDADILLYAAIIFEPEPAYESIQGKWLSNDNYVVLHRVAASPLAKGKRIATRLFEMVETLSVENNIYSIKVDTNFDNLPMLKILKNLNYTYCGEVFFRGGARMAFEKLLSKTT